MKILGDALEAILFEADSSGGERTQGIESQLLQIEIGGLCGTAGRGRESTPQFSFQVSGLVPMRN